jgi:hypothetical protein
LSVITRYSYDDLNRLAEVIENYDPPSNPDHETNLSTEYAYNAQGRRQMVSLRVFGQDAICGSVLHVWGRPAVVARAQAELVDGIQAQFAGAQFSYSFGGQA